MRPRFMNRGSARVQLPVLGIHLASMRPRFMNRGSKTIGSEQMQECGRFNEAPIHESGKCRRCRETGPRRSRFNEAPIHESGK